MGVDDMGVYGYFDGCGQMGVYGLFIGCGIFFQDFELILFIIYQNTSFKPKIGLGSYYEVLSD